MQTIETKMPTHTIVSREEWTRARRDLLAREKAHTRERDALSRERRELPWVKVEKNYVFDTPEGKRTLADLFAGRSQLVVNHFMFGPDWAEGCPTCSLTADGYDGASAHLAARDVTLVVVSRAPLARIEPFKRRMGWRFPWVSSFGTDFNRDFKVSFTKEEMAAGDAEYNFARKGFPADEAPGYSVFYKDERGSVFHTYTAYARGGEQFMLPYQFLDLVPKGRDEDGLSFTMAWVRHHDRYGPANAVDPNAEYAPSEKQAQATGGGCPACEATAEAHS